LILLATLSGAGAPVGLTVRITRFQEPVFHAPGGNKETIAGDPQGLVEVVP